MEYPKIHSLWKRQGFYDQAGKKILSKKVKNSFIEGDYAEEAFGNITHWNVDEKIDGTNIRIFYWDDFVRFGGRTKDSQIPCHLLSYLQDFFEIDRLKHAFPSSEQSYFPNVILFGEGYGPKIQACGGNYRKDVGFILFDVYCNGWWLKRDDVREIAEKLDVPMVPHIGIMREYEIVDYVKGKNKSLCSQTPQVMEGIVARSEPLLLFRDGRPVMFKLKVKDFE